jgi:AraC-like DNA-binding protein/ligand-binding sensor protein
MQTTYVRQSYENRRPSNDPPIATPPPEANPPGQRPPARSRPSLFKARPAQSGNSDRGLIEALTASKVFQEYERGFTEATGLPVALRPVETWQLPHHGKRNEGPFCSLISQKSRACASCLSVQETLSEMAVEQPHTIGCPNGLCDTAVPVRLGDRVIGFLQTGQVFRKKPSETQFERAAKQVMDWGVDASRSALHEAYFATRVVPPKQHEAIVKLLSIFAQHLSMLSNQVVVQQENAEPPVIIRAKEFIQEHQTENLRLGHVAKACNTSTFYFCKMFKKVTGINFTDYLSRVRIEKSKNLLLNPNLRVSEIAFEVGFQSLTHFNRVFKKILGQSPTEYRVQLLGARG